jgi:hypothetical protein
VCELLSSDRRPRAAESRSGPAMRVLLVGLCAGLSAVLGCDRPASKASNPERTVGAVVDGCRGVADGALCNDKNACTLNDRCVGGLCVGTSAPDGMSCTDENQCTSSDQCVQGKCLGIPVPEGTLCTDGDPCTDPDTCRKGQCTAGGPASCDDGDHCTVDQCIEGDGCRHDPILMCSDAGSGGDGGALDGDAGTPPDAPMADAGPDSTEVEVGPPGDAAPEEPPDAAPDVPLSDATSDEAALDAADDALADGAVDAIDGGEPGDAGDAGATDVLPAYQAQGGACVCSSSGGSSRPAAGVGLLLGAVLQSHRPRPGPR